jgi:A/G-specific adenine glycosylase
MNADPLLVWFRSNARQLPWRAEPRNPYLVIVSEFMLQQTQVDRVVPRFEAFVARFPDVAALAAADVDDVVHEWSGLGYYRRARMLHRMAVEVMSAGGSLPRTAAELEQLPGIGPYTAAAVASLAFGERIPVLDGNVLRVGSRCLASSADPRSAAGGRALREWVLELMADRSPAAVNEALMELGATVCTPSSPACDSCPLANGCRARAAGEQDRYPRPRRRRTAVDVRWVAAVCRRGDEWVLLRRIDDGPILNGLWLPPIGELRDGDDPVESAQRLVAGFGAHGGQVAGPVRHSITHRRIEVVPVRFECASIACVDDTWRWVDPSDPGVPTSSLLQKLVAASDREI